MASAQDPASSPLPGVGGVLMFDAAWPPPVLGGKEKQAHLLSRALLAQGVPVEVVSFARAGNAAGRAPFQGVPVTRLEQGTLLPLRLWRTLGELRERCDILHIHTPSRIGLTALLFGRLLEYRSVFKIPNEDMLEKDSWLMRSVWLAIVRQADRVVVLEESSATFLNDAGIAPERLARMVNGIEIPDECVTRPSEVRSPDDRLKLLFAGRLVPQKRCGDAIRALAAVRERGCPASLDVLGYGNEEEALHRLARDLGLGDDEIAFHGRVDDVEAWMRASDLMLLTSDREGMPNTVLEAMALGLPVLATRVGAVPDMLSSTPGMLVETGDLEQLSDKILELWRNPSRLAEVSSSLRGAARDRYSMTSVARQYIDLYREIGSRTRA